MNIEITKKLLSEYSLKADTWLKEAEKSFLASNYDFYKIFFERENLKKIEWPDIQELGEHIHSFTSMALAKHKALGKPNHDIDFYRNSFTYLAFGTDELKVRIRKFFKEPQYSIKNFGDSVNSEIVGNLFPDEFIFFNKRNETGIKILGINPPFEKGDDFVDRFFKYNDSLEPLKNLYKDIVKQRTKYPFNLEIDQFLDYLYVNYGKDINSIVEGQLENLLKLVSNVYPDWKGFQDERFIEDEILYKESIIDDAKEILSKDELSRLLDEGNFDEFFNRVEKIGTHKNNNLLYRSIPNSGDLAILYDKNLNRTSFCKSFYELIYGKGDIESRLDAYLEYIQKNNLKNKWTFPTYYLFIIFPETEMFVKPDIFKWFLGLFGINYSSKPSVEFYGKIKEITNALKDSLSHYGPKDMLDIQSFIFVAYSETLKEKKHKVAETEKAPSTDTNFWWLNSNPKIWNIAEHSVGSKVIYTTHNEKGNKRRVYKYFEQVKLGDVVLGYLSTPVKEITTVCRISKGIHDSGEGQGIELEITEQLDVSIPYTQLKENPDLQDCEPLINNQGTLFSLKKEEYDIIREMIDDANPSTGTLVKYTLPDALEEIFLSEDQLKEILSVLKYKKNIILQGPPGVGKTYIAKRLAYLKIGKKDHSKIKMIQFHQSYSYEDFIQGYRPHENGGFILKNGVFYEFCKKAWRHKDKDFFFIIDEINRGNLSKIFGELMMLLEHDKRGEEFSIPLTYAAGEDDYFYIPKNLHLIGTMNTADRSLAMVDYALRRRFAFITLAPMFINKKFKEFLRSKKADEKFIEELTSRMMNLNERIAKDSGNLGSGFCIGHSYFCTNGDDKPMDFKRFTQIVRFELTPLLKEYWFDNPEKAENEISTLLKEI